MLTTSDYAEETRLILQQAGAAILEIQSMTLEEIFLARIQAAGSHTTAVAGGEAPCGERPRKNVQTKGDSR